MDGENFKKKNKKYKNVFKKIKAGNTTFYSEKKGGHFNDFKRGIQIKRQGGNVRPNKCVGNYCD